MGAPVLNRVRGRFIQVTVWAALVGWAVSAAATAFAHDAAEASTPEPATSAPAGVEIKARRDALGASDRKLRGTIDRLPDLGGIPGLPVRDRLGDIARGFVPADPNLLDAAKQHSLDQMVQQVRRAASPDAADWDSNSYAAPAGDRQLDALPH